MKRAKIYNSFEAMKADNRPEKISNAERERRWERIKEMFKYIHENAIVVDHSKDAK